MPELARFFGIVVTIFFEDHNPPHVHVSHGSRRRPEWIAQIAIRDGRVIEGEIPSVALYLVRKWVSLHREELEGAWAAASEGRVPKKIAPLRVR